VLGNRCQKEQLLAAAFRRSKRFTLIENNPQKPKKLLVIGSQAA
jgi:hypothetical protein